MKVAIIGGGNLGSALAKALVKKYDVIVTRRNVEKIRYLRDLGCEITNDNVNAVKNSDVVILTVKKVHVYDILNEIPKNKITISFVAGLSYGELKNKLSKPVKAMTMLSAEFGKGITIYYSELDENDEKVVEEVLSSFGDVVKGDEREVDMLTAFASSIAFISKMYESFVYSGLRLGFRYDLAKRIAINVFEGAIALLKSYEPNEVIKRVTTPAGTTIEGIVKMFEHRVDFALIDAITTSAKRLMDL